MIRNSIIPAVRSSVLTTIGALCLFASCTNQHMEIEHEFENLYDELFLPDQPGGVVLVKKNNETVFLKSYGLADLESSEKITSNTVFNTGSISKTFVAYGILILEEAGQLTLEDSLVTYFPQFENPEIARKVRIKHLLTHTSGLPDLRRVQEKIEFYLTARDEENFAPLYQTEALHFMPGQQFEYSNPAFNGLALIIEQTTGQKWQDFIRETIFTPSGMDHSTITDGPHPEHGVAHGYIPQDGAFVELDYGEEPTFAAAGNGGVWSSVLDLAKYEEAIQKSLFLPAERIRQSREVYIPPNWQGDHKPDVGLSWFIADRSWPTNEFGVKIISHTGWQGGFRGFMISIPEKDILYIGLFNRPLATLSESFNPFTSTTENAGDLRVEGIRILQQHNWLD